VYIPPYYRNTDLEELKTFMRAFPFALIASNGALVPQATHLPFVLHEREGRIVLRSHFAKANPHWQSLQDGSEALVVFQGPHAYVSPSNYEKAQNVPTWNYIAVHARGLIKLLHNDQDARALLEEMIRAYEPGWFAQWQALDRQYVANMIKGIVAFEIEVLQLEGKFKLSQNKTANERQTIAAQLGKSDDGAAQQIASHMQEQEKKHHS